MAAQTPTEFQSIAALAEIVRNEGRAPAGVDALAAIFARSGIAVFDDALTSPLYSLQSPISPLVFQRWQLEPFAEQIGNGAAAPAGVLNDLIPPSTETDVPIPTAADLIAAYTAFGDTPGADFARALVGNLSSPDGASPSMEVESAMVPAPAALWAVMGGEVLGQLEDEVRKLPTGPVGPTSPNLPSLPGLPDFPPPVLPDGVTLPPLPRLDDSFCSSVQTFLNATMQRVFSTLSRSDAVEEIPVIGTLWAGLKKGVRLALEGIVILVTKTVDVVIKPVLSVLRVTFGLISLASTIVGTLTPWTATVTAEPNRTRFGVGAFEVVSGNLSIVAGGMDRLDWPPLLADCARVADLPLPEPTSARAAFTLSVVQPAVPLIDIGASPRELDDAGRATVTYATKNETQELARTGEAVIGIAYLRLEVERKDLERIRDNLQNLLFGSLGSLLRSIVELMVRPLVTDLTGRLLALVKADGHTMLFVTYHRPRQPTPTPPPAKPDPSLVGTWEITPADDWLLLYGVDPRESGYQIDALDGRWSLGFGPDGSASSTATQCVVAERVYLNPETGAQDDDHPLISAVTVNGTVRGSYTAQRGRIGWSWSSDTDFALLTGMGTVEWTAIDLQPLTTGLDFMGQRLVNARYRVKGDTLTLRCRPEDERSPDEFILTLRKVHR